jgi:hypothetical protein
MKLSQHEKAIVKNAIIILVGRGRISTQNVINNVCQSVQPLVPQCNEHHVSGCISTLAKKNSIQCLGGFCW